MADTAANFLGHLLEPKAVRKPGRPAKTAVPPGSLDAASVVRKIREGLPARSFAVLREALQLPAEQLARLVHIPPRTLARRRVFKADESERILRIGRLFQRAVDVLGDREEARRWLLQPQKALGNTAPLDF